MHMTFQEEATDSCVAAAGGWMATSGFMRTVRIIKDNARCSFRHGQRGVFVLTYWAIWVPVANQTPGFDFMYATNSSRCFIGARWPLK